MSDEATYPGFTDDEARALNEWRESRTRPSLSPETGSHLFRLFVHGFSCDEIQQENKAYTLGQILEVRVRDRWDDRKDKYLDHLYGGVHARVRQTQMESVCFTTDLLAAAHRLYGDQLRKFIQSGREEDLGEARQLIQSLDAYRKVADVLLKMTGQDKDKEKRSDIVPRTIITDRVVEAKEPQLQPPKALPAGTTEVMAPDLAARVLEMFAGKARDDHGRSD